MASKKSKASKAAAKGWETRRANARKAERQARAEARKRSAAARKGWETRKAHAREAPAPPKPTRLEPVAPVGPGGGGGRARPEPREYDYPPEFEGLDDFYGGMDFGEEDEY